MGRSTQPGKGGLSSPKKNFLKERLFYEEKQDLLKHNSLDNWIKVDLTKNPDQLLKFINSFPLPVSL
jgi:hypothetical protein